MLYNPQRMAFRSLPIPPLAPCSHDNLAEVRPPAARLSFFPLSEDWYVASVAVGCVCYTVGLLVFIYA